MVRLSTKDYNNLPVALRDKALMYAKLTANRQHIALTRFKKPISKIEATFQGMTDAQQADLQRDFEQEHITIEQDGNKTMFIRQPMRLPPPAPAEIHPEMHPLVPAETEPLTRWDRTRRAIERVDDKLANGFNTIRRKVSNGAIRAGTLAYHGCRSIASFFQWYNGRSAGLRLIFAGVAGIIL